MTHRTMSERSYHGATSRSPIYHTLGSLALHQSWHSCGDFNLFWSCPLNHLYTLATRVVGVIHFLCIPPPPPPPPPKNKKKTTKKQKKTKKNDERKEIFYLTKHFNTVIWHRINHEKQQQNKNNGWILFSTFTIVVFWAMCFTLIKFQLFFIFSEISILQWQFLLTFMTHTHSY